jgi:hypothetical protein
MESKWPPRLLGSYCNGMWHAMQPLNLHVNKKTGKIEPLRDEEWFLSLHEHKDTLAPYRAFAERVATATDLTLLDVREMARAVLKERK